MTVVERGYEINSMMYYYRNGFHNLKETMQLRNIRIRSLQMVKSTYALQKK